MGILDYIMQSGKDGQQAQEKDTAPAKDEGQSKVGSKVAEAIEKDGRPPWLQLKEQIEQGIPKPNRTVELVKRITPANQQRLAKDEAKMAVLRENLTARQFAKVQAILSEQSSFSYEGNMEEFRADLEDEIRNNYMRKDQEGRTGEQKVAMWNEALNDSLVSAADKATGGDKGDKKQYVLFDGDRYHVPLHLADEQERTGVYVADGYADLTLENIERGMVYDELEYSVHAEVVVKGTWNGHTFTIRVPARKTNVVLYRYPMVGVTSPKQDFDWKLW